MYKRQTIGLAFFERKMFLSMELLHQANVWIRRVFGNVFVGYLAHGIVYNTDKLGFFFLLKSRLLDDV